MLCVFLSQTKSLIIRLHSIQLYLTGFRYNQDGCSIPFSMGKDQAHNGGGAPADGWWMMGKGGGGQGETGQRRRQGEEGSRTVKLEARDTPSRVMMRLDHRFLRSLGTNDDLVFSELRRRKFEFRSVGIYLVKDKSSWLSSPSKWHFPREACSRIGPSTRPWGTPWLALDNEGWTN